MKLDKTLTKICKERKISISQLAKLTGLPQPTLHRWTTGRKIANIDDLKKVCDILRFLFISYFSMKQILTRLVTKRYCKNCSAVI